MPQADEGADVIPSYILEGFVDDFKKLDAGYVTLVISSRGLVKFMLLRYITFFCNAKGDPATLCFPILLEFEVFSNLTSLIRRRLNTILKKDGKCSSWQTLKH